MLKIKRVWLQIQDENEDDYLFPANKLDLEKIKALLENGEESLEEHAI